MDALTAWLTELGLPAAELEVTKEKLATHGVTTKKSCVGISTEEWGEIFSTVGFCYVVHDAARSIPVLDDLASYAALSHALTTSIEKASTDGDLIRATEARIRAQLKTVELNLAAATAEVFRGNFKVDELSSEIAACKAQLQSHSAEAAGLDVDMRTAFAEVDTANAAKEAAINQAVHSGVLAQQMSAIKMPSLDDVAMYSNKKVAQPVDEASWKKKMKWYVGAASRDDCEKRVLQSVCVPGTFLVRDGSSADAPYSLSVRFPGQGPLSAKHFRIVKLGDGCFQLALKVRDGFSTLNLPELVSYYMNIGIGAGVTLKDAAPPTPDANACPGCFAVCAPDTKFCKTCGHRMM